MSAAPVRILLVEDSPSDAELLQETLRQVDAGRFEFTLLDRLEVALTRLPHDSFDVLLLDLSLPDSAGPETFIRARAAAPHLPIIVLTGMSDEAVGIEAVRRDIQDYLIKGQADGRQIARTIRYAIERKQVEQALRTSEERLRLATTAANEAIWDWNLASGSMQWNETYAELFGRPPSTGASGNWWVERLHPEDRERVMSCLQDALRGRGDFWLSEYRFRCADNSWADIYDRAVIARDASGKAMRIVGAMLDLTEQKRAEAALRESEERYRQIVELSVDAILIQRDGRYVYVNPAAVNLFAADNPAGLVGQNVPDLVPAEFRPRLNQWMQELSHTRSLIPLEEMQIVRRDGQRVDVEVRATAIVLQAEPAIQMLMRDITERKRAERELQAAHAQLEAEVEERTTDLRLANQTLRMISQCNQALAHATHEQELTQNVCRIICEVGGYLMVWVGWAENDKAKTIRPIASAGFEDGYLTTAKNSWADNKYGRSPTGRAIREGTPCLVNDFANDPQLVSWRKEALLRGYRSSLALPLKTADRAFGALTLYAGQPAAFDASQVSLLSELADDLAFGVVAIRAKAERDRAQKSLEQKAIQLRALTAELAQAEERERRRLARILHDQVQQSLVGARYQLESLRGESQAKSFQRAARRIDELLAECLENSRSLTSELSPPILYEVGLGAALKWLGRWFRENHGLAVHVIAGDPTDTEAEEVRIALFQAVRELLFNVVKHARVKQAQVRMTRDKNGLVKIVVSDCGVGFDPVQLQSQEGTTGGFGLFSLRERLELLGGRMEIASAPGEGSRFTLQAPLGGPSRRTSG